MEILLALIVAGCVISAFSTGFVIGRTKSDSVTSNLDRLLVTTQDRLFQEKQENTKLLNTILMMRKEGNNAPPLDEDWGVYAMDDEE